MALLYLAVRALVLPFYAVLWLLLASGLGMRDAMTAIAVLAAVACTPYTLVLNRQSLHCRTGSPEDSGR